MEILKTGKIAPSVLEGILGKIGIDDSRVAVGPGIGEDAAAIDFGDRYLIVKSDPITFTTDRIGWYVVNINANDVAAMGGEPRWFLVTMLLPEERTTPSLIRDIMKDVSDSCRALGISLVGGPYPLRNDARGSRKKRACTDRRGYGWGHPLHDQGGCDRGDLDHRPRAGR